MRSSPLADAPRFHLLDAARGLAALAVVLYHWRNFAGVRPAPGAGPWVESAQPFWSWLSPFYSQGLQAVDFFFVLSGFVFYWLYADGIAADRVGFRRFFVLRFSRLYPLHFVTLLLVAAGQFALRACHFRPFLTPFNDLRHFVLQLFLAGSWGFESGQSFNLPAWSLSHEVLLYGLFFLVCRVCGVRLWLTCGLALLGPVLGGWLPWRLGDNIAGFFLGGLDCRLYVALSVRPGRGVWPVALGVCLVAWVLIPLNFSHHFVYRAYVELFGAHRYVAGHDLLGGAIMILTHPAAGFILFPLPVLALALLEARRSFAFAGLGFLGAISYSSYLLHFPLQLGCALLARLRHWSVAVFDTPAFFLGFFAVLLALSWLSYRCFELPCQRWLRRRFGA